METTQEKLESAYEALKGQCRALNLKLRDASLSLNNTVGELDVITYYLNSVLGQMSQGLLFVNLEGYITTCNAAAEAILEIDTHQVLFHAFTDFFRDDLFGFSMREALKLRSVPPKSFVRIDTRNESQRELEVDATFMLKNDSPAIEPLQGIIVLIRDVTDLHRLQEIAQRKDRMQELGAMAAMVAHEIRNPLGSIKGFAALLERDLQEQPSLQQMAAAIVQGADSLNRLVSNVLNYSRPFQTNFETIDLIQLLQELCRQVKADESLDPRIQIAVQTPVESLVAMVDAALLKSALLNLVVNAIQALPHGGEITLSAHQEKKLAIIKVSDTGIGIPQENLRKIFRPFFTTKPNGNGFGLAEVHRVIQAHAGTIDLSSTVDLGSTFTIKLPLTTPIMEKPYVY